MQNIVNGGVYSVNFTGISPQMNGNHPAVVFRTLKESDLYIIVPLTTYTEDRWNKTKRFGYGMRLIPSNSIAKIDKFIVLHKSCIMNRWKTKSTGEIVIVKGHDLSKLIKKTYDYMRLSLEKTDKEYKKYLVSYSLFEKNICEMGVFYDKLIIRKEDEKLEYDFSDENYFKVLTANSTEFTFQAQKSLLNEVSMDDIQYIITTNLKNATFNIHQTNLVIKIIC